MSWQHAMTYCQKVLDVYQNSQTGNYMVCNAKNQQKQSVLHFKNFKVQQHKFSDATLHIQIILLQQVNIKNTLTASTTSNDAGDLFLHM